MQNTEVILARALGKEIVGPILSLLPRAAPGALKLAARNASGPTRRCDRSAAPRKFLCALREEHLSVTFQVLHNDIAGMKLERRDPRHRGC